MGATFTMRQHDRIPTKRLASSLCEAQQRLLHRTLRMVIARAVVAVVAMTIRAGRAATGVAATRTITRILRLHLHVTPPHHHQYQPARPHRLHYQRRYHSVVKGSALLLSIHHRPAPLDHRVILAPPKVLAPRILGMAALCASRASQRTRNRSSSRSQGATLVTSSR